MANAWLNSSNNGAARPKKAAIPAASSSAPRDIHGPDGQYLTSGFEYETIWALAAHTTIKDLDYIAQMDRLCDDLGLDTIETGVTLGVFMEGGIIPWGDGPAAIDLLKKVYTDDPWGRILGNGAAFTGQALGVSRVPVVKRQAFPAYDPRAEKGMGLTYATSPMGADHTSGYTVAVNICQMRRWRAIL